MEWLIVGGAMLAFGLAFDFCVYAKNRRSRGLPVFSRKVL